MNNIIPLHRPRTAAADAARVRRALVRLLRAAAEQERRRGVVELRKTLRAGEARRAVRRAAAAQEAAVRRAADRAAADRAAFAARARAVLALEADRLRDRAAGADIVMRSVSW
jgi:hypothetical protein